jgi:hypothetical protein
MPKKEDYWRDPEKFRARTKAYNDAHPEWKRESGKLWMRKKRAALGETGRREQRIREKTRDPVGYLLDHARARAKKVGVPFDLSREDIVMPERCPVLGIEFKWGTGAMGWRNMASPSLDRIIPRLGYVRGNVRVISNRANHLKSNGTISEFEAVLAYMKREGAEYALSGNAEPVELPPSPQLGFGW